MQHSRSVPETGAGTANANRWPGMAASAAGDAASAHTRSGSASTSCSRVTRTVASHITTPFLHRRRSRQRSIVRSVFARQQAIDHPDKAAIIMAPSGETVTFGEYEARSNQIAHLLRDAGLRRGDHIAILMENSPQLLEIASAAERTGLYYSAINTYLGADEVAYVVANSQAKVLFSSTARREVAEAAAAKCPGLDRMLMTGPGPLPGGGWEPYDAVVAGYPDGPVADEALGAAMLYSSGTTGYPKGVLRELPTGGPDQPLPVMAFVQGMFGFRAGMTYLNPAPL